MIATISHGKDSYKIDLERPLDISIPLITGVHPQLTAWGIKGPSILPHKEGDYVGEVSQGASVNFNNIHFNPHSHVTHTESVGHISVEKLSVNKLFPRFFFTATVVTIAPEKYQDDFVISRKQLEYSIHDKYCEAIIIRTLPNTDVKKSFDYSNTNPPYLLEEAAKFLAEKGIVHLLVDLPSVDKEQDYGALLAHRAFWDVEGSLRKEATITELVFIDNSIADGQYILNLQTAPIENDATPSRPVLYEIITD